MASAACASAEPPLDDEPIEPIEPIDEEPVDELIIIDDEPIISPIAFAADAPVRSPIVVFSVPHSVAACCPINIFSTHLTGAFAIVS